MTSHKRAALANVRSLLLFMSKGRSRFGRSLWKMRGDDVDLGEIGALMDRKFMLCEASVSAQATISYQHVLTAIAA
jgi:hypothetical protein